MAELQASKKNPIQYGSPFILYVNMKIMQIWNSFSLAYCNIFVDVIVSCKMYKRYISTIQIGPVCKTN